MLQLHLSQPPIKSQTASETSESRRAQRHTVVLKEKDIKKKGHLFKKGNNILKDWRDRFCVLYKSRLYYYDSEQVGQSFLELAEFLQDQLPLGIIDLTTCDVPIVQPKQRKYYFDLHSPGRTYNFMAESLEEASSWVQAIEEVQKLHLQPKQRGTQYQPLPAFPQQPAESATSARSPSTGNYHKIPRNLSARQIM